MLWRRLAYEAPRHLSQLSRFALGFNELATLEHTLGWNTCGRHYYSAVRTGVASMGIHWLVTGWVIFGVKTIASVLWWVN